MATASFMSDVHSYLVFRVLCKFVLFFKKLFLQHQSIYISENAQNCAQQGTSHMAEAAFYDSMEHPFLFYPAISLFLLKPALEVF